MSLVAETFHQSLRQHVPKAAIVFDKFHVMKHVNDAVDETRRVQSRRGPITRSF